MKYVVERAGFERWVKDQLHFTKKNLERDDEDEYIDKTTAVLFLGFIAGWKVGQMYA